MTDNGPAFKSRRYAKALRRLTIRHKRTRPYTPKTNGKAERFVQTSLREWAYARAYDTSEQRRAELPAFLFRYNWHRPHGSINGRTPISRLGLAEDNLLSLHKRSLPTRGAPASHPLGPVVRLARESGPPRRGRLQHPVLQTRLVTPPTSIRPHLLSALPRQAEAA